MATKKFYICVPDYVNRLVWCQHFNGKWAPPFPMMIEEKTKDPSKNDESNVK